MSGGLTCSERLNVSHKIFEPYLLGMAIYAGGEMTLVESRLDSY
jgi:hypothetical protein